jgi:cell filamentation protein
MAHLFRNLRSRIRSLSHRAAFVPYAAHFLAELNAIHPFREGNGRTQLAFLTVVAAHFGFRFEPSSLDPASFLNAMIRAFEGNEEDLTDQLNRMIE